MLPRYCLLNLNEHINRNEKYFKSGYIISCQKYARCTQLFSLNIMSFKQRMIFNVLVDISKFMKNTWPSYISDKIMVSPKAPFSPPSQAEAQGR